MDEPPHMFLTNFVVMNVSLRNEHLRRLFQTNMYLLMCLECLLDSCAYTLSSQTPPYHPCTLAFRKSRFGPVCSDQSRLSSLLLARTCLSVYRSPSFLCFSSGTWPCQTLSEGGAAEAGLRALLLRWLCGLLPAVSPGCSSTPLN